MVERPPRRVIGIRIASLASLLFGAGLLAATGCDVGSAIEEPTVVAPPPSPEIRFDRFIEELRRRFEASSNSSGLHTGGGARYSGGYHVVSNEVAPPETKAGVYRAKLTVREVSSFTLYVRSDPEEPEEDETDLDDTNPLLGAEGETDELLQPGEAAPRARLTPSPLQTKTHEELLEFDFAYVDGEWVLRTEIDPVERRFLSEAFRLALDRQ